MGFFTFRTKIYVFRTDGFSYCQYSKLNKAFKMIGHSNKGLRFKFNKLHPLFFFNFSSNYISPQSMLATIATRSMFPCLEVKMINIFIISLFYPRCIQYLIHSTLVLWPRSSALTEFLPIRLKRSFGQKYWVRYLAKIIHMYSPLLRKNYP